MKRADSQRWFIRAGSPLLFYGVCSLLLMMVVIPVGCGQFNDYVVAPTIVDVSDRPPYITSLAEVPKNKPAPIYPLPHPSSESDDVAMNDYYNSGVTVTAVESEKSLAASVTQSRPRRMLYEYAPNHPDANEHGYIEILNPDYAEPRSKRSPELSVRPQDTLAIRPVAAVPFPEPKGKGPDVTEVTITGTGPPPRQGIASSISVREVKTIDAGEEQEVAPVQEPSLQTVAVAKGPEKIGENYLQKNEALVTSTVAVNPVGGLQQEATSPSLLAADVAPVAKPFPVDSARATIEDLRKLVRDNPDDAQKQLSLRFLYLAYGEKEKALELFSSIPADKQAEAISIVRAAMLTAKASGGSAETDDAGKPDSAGRALEALTVLAESMAEKTDLEVSHLEICQDQSVRGFGQYERLTDNLLASGEPRKVQIYCELKNFKSQLNGSGKYITSIAASIELIDEDYRTIYQLPKSDIPDVPSYRPRRDFFFRGQIKLPRLLPGKYEFVVKVEDKYAGKIARPFRKTFEVKSIK